MAEKGREKITLLAPDAQTAYRFRKALARHGLEVRERWVQFPRLDLKESSKSTLDLVMSPLDRDRPDGLIIADDNLLEGAVEWLEQSGLCLPEELSVVTQNNFPHVIPSKVPLVRFGFEIPALLEMLMDRLQKVAVGQDVAENSIQSVISEEEFIKGSSVR